MSDSVPDPDDGMLENVENIDRDHVVEEMNEPGDDLNIDFLDSTNSNQDDYHAVAETDPPPPAPEERRNVLAKDTKKVQNEILVYTEAVCLESICNSFVGIVLHERLQFIIDRCPPLRRDATITLAKSLKELTMNVARYNTLMSSLELLDSVPTYPKHLELPKNDTVWAETTLTKATNLLDYLQGEYKKMKDEGVKESTRRAMEELFAHYVAVGSYTEALRLYGRGMREYCTQFKHFMKMWIEWLIVSVCAGEWNKIEPLISQAQRSINEMEEAEEKAQVAANSNRPHQNPAEHVVQLDSVSRANRALINACQTKLDALSGVCRMKSLQYGQALDKFTKTDVDIMGNDWLFSSSDIAAYTTLCALVAYDRSDVKKKVLTDSLCRKFLEAEPRLIELLNCFIRSDFGRCLDILAEKKNSFYLNPFLAQHVDDIYERIRQRAVIQYIRPFATARLDIMADVFRVLPVQMEEEVVRLIEKDLINAKIDALEGVVRTTQVDQRTDTLQKVDKLCDSILETGYGVICRAILCQARMYTGGERNNKRKEPSDEGYDIVSGSSRGRTMGIFKSMLGNRKDPFNFDM